MNLTTEDYEKINNLIQTNEDENKAIAAGIIANMDEEQLFNWLDFLVDGHYKPFIENVFKSRVEYEYIIFSIKISINLVKEPKKGFFSRENRVSISNNKQVIASIDADLGFLCSLHRWYAAPLILQAFKDLFK